MLDDMKRRFPENTAEVYPLFCILALKQEEYGKALEYADLLHKHGMIALAKTVEGICRYMLGQDAVADEAYSRAVSESIEIGPIVDNVRKYYEDKRAGKHISGKMPLLPSP